MAEKRCYTVKEIQEMLADLMNLIPEAIEFRKSAEVPILKREKNKVVMLKITINSIDNKTIYGEGCLCR